jgi:hypothetical protein
MFILCHNNIDIFHLVELKPNAKLLSGQPHIEEFEIKKEAENRIKEIKSGKN